MAHRMRRHSILFLMLASVSLLTGQPVGRDTISLWQKIEAERLPDMNLPRSGHNVFYANGELTVVGGHTSGLVMTSTAEYFSNGEWHVVPTVYPHDNGMAVVMDNGKKVLLCGGHERNLGIGQSYEAEMYNSTTHIFEGFGSLDHKRAFAQGVELDSGRVLITGNHCDNDAFEVFDGQKFFHHVKEVAAWRSSPYLLPVSDDVIAFGAVWRGRFEPCDTVDRLNGEPFSVPLLKNWMPFLYTQNNHAVESFIGDEALNDYSYLVAAYNHDGEVVFIHIKDTAFSLLQTTVPVPTMSDYGSIKYDHPAIADPRAKRAYLIGNDSTSRVYVVAVDYDKQPAPLTLYYMGPLDGFGDASPVLTPDGDLLVAGGIIGDNFSPLASVWLLHTGTPKVAATTETSRDLTWLWVLGGLLFVVAIVLVIRRFASLRGTKQSREQVETTDSGLDCFVVPPRIDEDNEEPAAQSDNATNELMTRVTQLMETQHLYLNPELKITDVADALGVHRNAVSACINAQGCTFSQLVNDYRLKHAKQLLCQTSDMKISTVASESGFANESTFFRAFKADTGMTPKEWVAQQSVS